ncbi:hypothetical protein Ddye_014134 [Dipteronia dyeriana]|uniref:F-box domain-containing protein n=1 Tax=Dipteronia dyeriana TaxID=168575 RepID=A0AAD9X894_9ROSI|nr:hypothetical protein Ddye_014134 [Dipteronia dyeriana]
MEFLRKPLHVQNLAVADLPPEMIVNILSRLPVKSLCRLRCVSKSWLALIRDSRFVKMHLTQTQRENLFIETKNCSFYSIDLESITYDVDKVDAVKLDFDIEGREWNPWNPLLCYSNGLLCIVLEKCFWLYNPSTRECKQVKFQGDPKLSLGFGFSYVDSIDDYKFVRLHYLGRIIVEIYSLRKNSWKSIEHDLSNIMYDFYGTMGFPLNGAIHWEFDNVYNYQNPRVIVAFDLFEESLKTLSLPNTIVGSRFVGIFGGYLCVECVELRSIRCDISHISEIWVMKEYGVKASWTRILTVNTVQFANLLCYLKNSNIMMFSSLERLAFYNPEYRKFKKIEVDGIQMFSVYPYMESLVSPNYENHFTTEDQDFLEYWF